MFYIYADGKPLYYPLTDDLMVLSPKLTLEMGKAGSLSFQLPPSNQLYQSLQKLKTVITVEDEGTEIFRGRVLSEERGFNNIKEVYCEGDLAYLVDSVQKSEAFHGTTHGLFAKILDAHNARVESTKRFLKGNVTVENRSIIIAGQSEDIEDAETDDFDYRQIAINSMTNEWKTSYDYISSCLIDYCGGYLRTRRVGNNTYLDYVTDYGNTTTQEIEFGVNMLDLTEELSTEDLFTVLIPLGDENLTIASVNGGSDELADAAAVKKYGRIVRTHVFDSVFEPSTLLENGKRYLASKVNIPVTLTIKAVDLNLVNPDIQVIRVGDVVQVRSAPHGIVDKQTCAKIEYDLENAANTVYTFGLPRQTLTERYRKNKSEAEEKTEQAATEAAGASGGGSSGKAKDELEKAINKAYEEWVDWDPENPDGHVSIGAIYRQYEKDKKVLENEVGIDFNAVTGNVSIKNLRTEFDEMEVKVDIQGALIESNNTETKAELVLQAGRWKDLDEREQGHYAEMKLTVEEVEGELITAISLKADKISMDAEVTRIYNTIDGIEEDIATFSREITTIHSNITSVRKLIADEIETLKTDTTWLSSLVAKINVLEASTIHATTVSAQGMTINNKLVATNDWVKDYLTTNGYLTDNGVSWGSVGDGTVWLNVDGTNRRLSMGNHTHSSYASASHTHSEYITGVSIRVSKSGAVVMQGDGTTRYIEWVTGVSVNY